MLPADASLLDLMIARLTTQRDFLERAAGLIEAIDGPILEVGFGKGRTYSHLRKVIIGREIIAFDRELHAPPKAQPPRSELVLGDFASTLQATADRIGRSAALAHADFGSPDIDRDAHQAEWLGPLLQRLVRRDGLVVSDRQLNVQGWELLDDGTSHAWRYFIWRVRS